jgi:signal transduction histidine kinase
MTPLSLPRQGVVIDARVDAGRIGHGGPTPAGAPAGDAALQAFTLAVSHDLRAPLRAIEGYAQALVEDYADGLPTAAQQMLARIRQATVTLEHRLDALLHVSRLGGDALRLSACDLAPAVVRVLEDLRRREPARSVDARVPASIPVHGDAALLGIVVENLLTNAWKFTRGRPDARIDVDVQPSGDDLVLSVRDNGIGFDMRQAHRLCLPFQRLHSAECYEGTGIGLASARRIVERHGGRVWADSAPGAGATFHVSLPSVRIR